MIVACFVIALICTGAEAMKVQTQGPALGWLGMFFFILAFALPAFGVA